MRISDWSSDVCSSDLPFQRPPVRAYPQRDDPYLGRAIGRQGSRGSASHLPDRPVRAPKFRSFDIRAEFPDRRVGSGPLLHHAAGAETLRQFSRSEEHTSELQSLMRISYAVFCLKKKKYT